MQLLADDHAHRKYRSPSTAGDRVPGWWVGIGALAGATVGAIARGWMRLITDEPEFTWNGTIFIVAAFTILGSGHATAAVARTRSRRRGSTAGRVAGAVSTLPIFAGAGVFMFPTVLLGALARWRTDWPPAVRGVLGLLALPMPVFVVADVVRHGITVGRLAGSVLLLATYALVITGAGAVAAPLDDG